MEASIAKLSEGRHDELDPTSKDLSNMTDSEFDQHFDDLRAQESGFSMDEFLKEDEKVGNLGKAEKEAFLREETRENVRRSIEASTGDVVISRSVKIPTKAQVEAGMSPKSISIEQEQVRDMEYIKDRFPVGSEINIFENDFAPLRRIDKIRAVVTGIKRDANGIYLRVLCSYKGAMQWRDVAALNAMDANKDIKDVVKGAMSREQINNMIARIDSGDIRKAA